MNWTLIMAIIRAKRKGLLRLTEVTEPVNFICLADKCAKCCKTIGSPVVTPHEAEKIDPGSIVKDKKGMFIRSKNGVCCMLEKGLCSIYPVRPSGCREYPWYNIDGKLYYDSGCPGMGYQTNDHPEIDQIQPFENFFPDMPKFAVRIIKKACVK